LKQASAYLLLSGIIVLTLSYLSDIYELFINEKFYEGYLFAIKIILFDLAMLVPFILALASKHGLTFKLWAVAAVVLPNFVLMMGFKAGAIYSVIIGLLLIAFFVVKYKSFEMKSVT